MVSGYLTKKGVPAKRKGRKHTVHVVLRSSRTDPALGQFRCRKCGLRFDSVMLIQKVGDMNPSPEPQVQKEPPPSEAPDGPPSPSNP